MESRPGALEYNFLFLNENESIGYVARSVTFVPDQMGGIMRNDRERFGDARMHSTWVESNPSFRDLLVQRLERKGVKAVFSQESVEVSGARGEMMFGGHDVDSVHRRMWRLRVHTEAEPPNRKKAKTGE